MIFKQAFRWAFIVIIWKQYKASIISTLILLAYLIVVSSIHQDYLTAVGPENIDRASFIYKWIAWISGISVYILYQAIRSKIKPNKQSTKEKIAKSKELTSSDNDPFSAIRDRKTLRSRADFLMDKENND